MTVEERNDFAGREAERTAPGGDDPAWDGDRLREAVAFFRNEKGFRRLITLMIQKYRALGRVGGSVKIRDLTPEEREAFSSFLGANFEGRRTAVISLERFARALEETRFAGLPLAAVLEGVAGEPLIPDKERRDGKRRGNGPFSTVCENGFPLPTAGVGWTPSGRSGREPAGCTGHTIGIPVPWRKRWSTFWLP